MMIWRSALIFAAVYAMLTVLSVTAFAQMQERPGAGPGGGGMGQGRNGMGQDSMIRGEVAEIDDRSLTVTTQAGETKQVAITARTLFVKEIVSDKSALVQGANVFVLGPPSGNSITPIVIRIIESVEGGQRPGGQGGQTQMTSGPIIGSIASVEPLTIQKTSGETTVIQVTAETKIVRETAISASEIIKGTQVRVIAPQGPGGGSREARKVIVVSESGPLK